MLYAPTTGVAGEIAGLPANTPPTIDAPFQFSFSNDFLGRGGGSDDFRTQQFIIGARLKDRWDLTLDHSILTQIEADEPGRTDQLSVTLGYRLIDEHSVNSMSRLTVGGGLRSYGSFGGERMQNGFHQLIGSNVEQVPYTDLERTDGVAWVDTHHYHLLQDSSDSSDWRWGYWLRGSALGSDEGQVDAALAAYAVGSKNTFDFWLGLRQDWRTGYEAAIVRETAESEQELAAVIGLRWGPMVFETVQQFDGDGSYGQLRLLATGFSEGRAVSSRHRFEIEAGFVVPDVHATLTGRWRAAFLNGSQALWQRSLLLTTAFGRPQQGDDPQIYSDSLQLGAGIEWERRLGAADGSLGLYWSFGAGWREEQLFGDGDRQGQRAESVSGGVAFGSAGLRFNAAELFSNFNLRLHLGLTGWVPFEKHDVVMEGETFRVHEPKIGVALGFTVGRFAAD